MWNIARDHTFIPFRSKLKTGRISLLQLSDSGAFGASSVSIAISDALRHEARPAGTRRKFSDA
jgi:hypothetical protein